LPLAVVPAGPVPTGAQRAADFHQAIGGVEAGVTWRSDDVPGRSVDGDERATRIQRIGKELPEDIFFVPVGVGVLLPDERIRRHGEQRGPIVLTQRPQLEELAGKSRLAIEHHGPEGRVFLHSASAIERAVSRASRMSCSWMSMRSSRDMAWLARAVAAALCHLARPRLAPPSLHDGEVLLRRP